MIDQVTMTETGLTPRAMLEELGEAAREAAETTAEQWHREMMPGHFETSATAKYGYQPRKGDNQAKMVMGKHAKMIFNRAYSWKKRFIKHHNRPLIWSGNSEQLAKQAVRISSKLVKKTGEVVAKAVMSLPTYFYKYKPDQPNKADELTRVTAEETAELTHTYQTRFESALPERGGSASHETRIV